MKDIYLMLENGHYFADEIRFCQIDIEKIIKCFNKKNLSIHILNVGNTNFPKDSIVFTMSSPKRYQKQLVDDYLEVLEHYNNVLIPTKNIIRAHENKGYQEYHKKLLNFKSLRGVYINKHSISYREIDDYIGYPLVLKKVDGSGSRGVFLINNEKQLIEKISKKRFSFNIRGLIYLKEKIKRIMFRKNNLGKIEFFTDYENYVVQEFIPNLKFDYKVLIFFNKYYVLKRNIKDNDFRASGSGSFEFVEVDESLLEYAKKVFEIFSEPFISLDICFDGQNYYLIEYQGIHFGLYTHKYSKGFYQNKDEHWKFFNEKVSIEEDIVYSLLNYMDENELL